MKGIGKAREIQERYIALDIHKEYVLAGGQNAAQEWVMQPRRISMERFQEWAIANLREGDAVVLETTTNVWDLYDIIAPLVSRAVVAHAGVGLGSEREQTHGIDVQTVCQIWTYEVRNRNRYHTLCTQECSEAVSATGRSLGAND